MGHFHLKNGKIRCFSPLLNHPNPNKTPIALKKPINAQRLSIFMLSKINTDTMPIIPSASAEMINIGIVFDRVIIRPISLRTDNKSIIADTA